MQAKTTSSVQPRLTPKATGRDGPTKKLTKKAPNVTAGHNFDPKIKRAAKEMPVGGHTNVANPFTAFKLRAHWAVAK